MISGFDAYNALAGELNAMIGSFERDYGINPVNPNNHEELLGLHDFSNPDKFARFTEVMARYQAFIRLESGTESGNAFDRMHDEHLDTMAYV